MAHWTEVKAELFDSLPMYVFLAEHEGALWSASMHDRVHPKTTEEFLWSAGRLPWRKDESDLLRAASAQVRQYFEGTRRSFDIPVHWRGTPFQVSVWKQLTHIPFGSMQSYGEVAAALGRPQACRAVGGANGRNHAPLFVPCHRVIAAGGKLGGFTGGLGLKKRLLAHEAGVLARTEAAA